MYDVMAGSVNELSSKFKSPFHIDHVKGLLFEWSWGHEGKSQGVAWSFLIKSYFCSTVSVLWDPFSLVQWRIQCGRKCQADHENSFINARISWRRVISFCMTTWSKLCQAEALLFSQESIKERYDSFISILLFLPHPLLINRGNPKQLFRIKFRFHNSYLRTIKGFFFKL